MEICSVFADITTSNKRYHKPLSSKWAGRQTVWETAQVQIFRMDLRTVSAEWAAQMRLFCRCQFWRNRYSPSLRYHTHHTITI